MARQRGIRINGPLLRARRAEVGWTQEAAAAAIGVSVKLWKKAEASLPIDPRSVALIAAGITTSSRVVAPHDLILPEEPGLQPAELPAALAALVDDWFRVVWGNDQWENVVGLLAPTIQFHCRLGVLSTPQEIHAEVLAIRQSFSSFSTEISSTTLLGSLVVTRWHVNCRQTSEWLGNPPLDEWVAFAGITTFRVERDKIAECWEFWNPLTAYARLLSSGSRGPHIVHEPALKSLQPKPPQQACAQTFRIRRQVLKDLRRRQAWTQGDAAQALELSERLIRKAEAGEPIAAESIVRIARGIVAAGQRIRPEELLADPRQLKFLPPESFELGARVQRWFDAQWNRPSLQELEQMATEDFTFHTEVGVVRGPAELAERVREFQKSFSDFDMRAEEVCDLGDSLIVRWNCGMTHTGTWLHLPATGRRGQVRGSSWARLTGDRFSEAWDFWDPALLLAQLTA